MNRGFIASARKHDTREKIALGGLIVRAGLRLEKPALLFAALTELRHRLESDDKERERLMAIGAEIVNNDTD